MDQFFDQKNIARYRKLRDAGMDETQRAMILKQLACENGQGFIFSCPMAAPDLLDLLDEESEPRVELRAA